MTDVFYIMLINKCLVVAYICFLSFHLEHSIEVVSFSNFNLSKKQFKIKFIFKIDPPKDLKISVPI